MLSFEFRIYTKNGDGLTNLDLCVENNYFTFIFHLLCITQLMIDQKVENTC